MNLEAQVRKTKEKGGTKSSDQVLEEKDSH